MHLRSFHRVFAPVLIAVTMWTCVALAGDPAPAEAPPHDFAGTKAGQTRKDNGLA